MTTRNDATNETAGPVRPAAALEAGGRPSSLVTSSLPRLTARDNTETPCDPVFDALLLLAQRGRAIREERERHAAAAGVE